MISFNQTFEESRAIRVLVVPIGENCMYDKHFETVSRRRSIPIHDLNKPSDWKNHNSPFKNFNWQSTGDIKFEYFRYDRAAHGPSDLENFLASRRVLVVIGVINYPELDSSVSSKLEVEMDYYSRRYPSIVVRRYFVFNYFEAKEGSPLLELTAKTTAQDPYAMVIFPPDRECEGGSMIDVHTQEIMSNVSVKLFGALEFHVLKCEEYRSKAVNVAASYKSNPSVTASSLLPSWLSLSTPYDDLEEVSGSSSSSSSAAIAEKQKRSKKRINGRMKKWIGDVCLQICSPFDALDYFNAAISECRSQHDHMWLASALEGSVVAMLTVLEQESTSGINRNPPINNNDDANMNPGQLVQNEDMLEQLPAFVKELKTLTSHGMSVSNAILRLSETRCCDSMGFYSKSLALCGLEVECALKCARMHEKYNMELGCGEDANGLGSRCEKAMEYIMRAVAVPGLNVQQQIECTLEGAFACNRMGMKRKYAFLLYVAATLSSNADNTDVAYALVQKACEQYGTKLVSKNCSANISHDDIGMHVSDPDSSWAAMRRVLFAHCAHFATENGDSVGAVESLTTLLRLVGEMEENRVDCQKTWVRDAVDDMQDQSVSEASLANSRPQSNAFDGTNMGSNPLLDVSTFPPKPFLRSSYSNSPLPRKFSSSSNPHDIATVALLNRSTLSCNAEAIARLYHPPSMTQDGESNLNTDSSVHNPANGNTMDSNNSDIVDSQVESNAQEDEEDSEGRDHDNNSDIADVQESRGRISIPKIAPFVQNLVSIGGSIKKRHRNREDGISFNASSVSAVLDSSMSSATGFISNIRSHVSSNISPSKNLPSPARRNVTASSSSSSSSTWTQKYPSLSGPALLTVVGEIPSDSSATASFAAREDSSSRLGVPIELQRHLMRVMSSLCAKLPPATSLLLEGLPFLLCVKPLEMQDQYKPIKIEVMVPTVSDGIEAQNAVSQSALFYDPFEARRRREKGLTAALEVLWSIGDLCYLKAIFVNPLAVAIIIHDVRVLFSDGEDCADVTSYALETLIVPPFCNNGYEVVLTVRPRSKGLVKMKGVQYSLFNGVHTAVVEDQTGKGVHFMNKELSMPFNYPRSIHQGFRKRPPRPTLGPNNVNPLLIGQSRQNGGEDNPQRRKGTIEDIDRKAVITVAPACALLRLSTSWMPEYAEFAASDVTSMEDGQLSSQVEIFEGEERVEVISLSNISSQLKIEDIRLSVHYSVGGGDAGPDTIATEGIECLKDFSYIKTDPKPVPECAMKPLLVTLKSLPILPIDPQSTASFELSISAPQSHQSSRQINLRVEVEYATRTDEWDDILSSTGSTQKKTLYIRKAFAETAVIPSRSIRIVNITTLISASTDENYAGEDASIGNLLPGSISALREVIRQSVESVELESFGSKIGENINSVKDASKGPLSISIPAETAQTTSDINILHEHRLFCIEVCNDSNFLVRLDCGNISSNAMGMGLFQCYVPEASSKKDSVVLAAASSIKLLLSISDEHVCSVLRKACDKKEILSGNDSQGETIQLLLTKAYSELLSGIQIKWYVESDYNSRQGFLGAGHIDVLVPPIYQQMMPHPFDVNVVVKNALEHGPSRAVLSSRRFYEVHVNVAFQPDLMKLFEPKFTHIEIFIVLNSSRGVLHSIHRNNSALSSNCQMLLHGRSRVEIPLSSLSADHSIRVCCARNGHYGIRIVARFLRYDMEGGSKTETSSFWTTQEPFECIAK